jgi:hypothetical protein
MINQSFRCKRILLLSVICGFFLAIGSASCQDKKFTFYEDSNGILLEYSNQNIFFYQKQTKSLDGQYPRANYIHPLYGLNGEVLTEDFPADHLHHRGIFWAWHQLYVKDEKVGDPWACEGIKWQVSETETEVFPDSAILRVIVFWTGIIPWESMKEQKPEDLINEKTVITCKFIQPDRVEINFDISLTALYEGTRIGGSEDEKGYSGFSIRTRLPEDLVFYSSRGKVIPEVTAIQAGGWIDMQGTFDPEENEQTVITIMCNPEDPQPFHGWILRDKGSMQNAAFPGRRPVSIPKGETLRLKYKILLHRNNMTKEQIEDIYNQFLTNY